MHVHEQNCTVLKQENPLAEGMSQLVSKQIPRPSLRQAQPPSPRPKPNPAERQAMLDYLHHFGQYYPIISAGDVYRLLTDPDDATTHRVKGLLVETMELARANTDLVRASLYAACIEYINAQPPPDGRYFLARFVLQQSISYYQILSTLD